MKTTFQLSLVGAYLGLAACQSSLQLPAGAELLLGPIKTSFRCPMSYGYYADEDNGCRVFHVCNPVQKGDRVKMEKYSFICGNLTMFDQLSQTCTFPDNAIPCGNAAEFFYLNERVGVEKAFFHEDEDIARAAKLVPLYGRYADSTTLNGRPGGKPLGFKGRAFFTNRDRKPAQSVREDLNVTRINKAKNNRIYVPLGGGLLNVRKNPQAAPPIGSGEKLAGRRRASTPSFGPLPGYGNRLNLDVINFRDNDFKVRRLRLASRQRSQTAGAQHTPDGKFVTSRERLAEESLRQAEFDDGQSQTTASGKERASHGPTRNDDKPSTADGPDSAPIPSTTPATPSESTTQEANIGTVRTADETKTRAGNETEKPDVEETPKSEGTINSSTEKADPRSAPAQNLATAKPSAKSTPLKESSPKSANHAKKASKKMESGSRRVEKMSEAVSSETGASATVGKQSLKSTAATSAKSTDPTTKTAPPASRMQKKFRSTAAPISSTEAPSSVTSSRSTTAQPTSATPGTNALTSAERTRGSTTEPATTESDSTTPQVSSTASDEFQRASSKPAGDTQTLNATTAAPLENESEVSDESKANSSSSAETPRPHVTNSPMIVVTIPPLAAVTSSTTTVTELVSA